MYAVVKFLLEDTVSEVPDTWIDGTDKCWWPSKNPKYFIQKGIAPGTGPYYSQWKKHDVIIEGTCLSYEMARRMAAEFSSSEETLKGRGKRQVVHTINNDYEYSYGSDSETTVLTCLPKMPTQLTKSLQRKNESSSQLKEGTTTTEKDDQLETYQQSVLDITNAEIITVEQFYEENDDQRSENLQDDPVSVSDVPERNDQASASGKTKKEDEEVLRLLIKISLQLDSIDQRLSKLEKRNRQDNEHDITNKFKFIKELLPMTLEKMPNVDNILTSNMEIVKELNDFLHTIGGNNPRDSIHRILSHLFTNECATKCSWKGYRNNRQVYDLKVIEVMKEVIVGNFSYTTHHEIEQISAEWFRFAKQRYDREKKRLGAKSS